jgi:hypothetical protein
MSAFEADRFNHSRTSPDYSYQPSIISGQFKNHRLTALSKKFLQHFGCASG